MSDTWFVSLERMSDLSKSNRKSLNEADQFLAYRQLTLRARCSGWTLRAHGAGWAHRTGCARLRPPCRNSCRIRSRCRTDRRKDCAFHPLDFSGPWNTRRSIGLEAVREWQLTVW